MMRVRPVRSPEERHRRNGRRPHPPPRTRPATLEAPPEAPPERVVADDERRHRAAGGPQDTAHYTCTCGMVFEADVKTSVACPRCSTPQAW